MQHKLPELINSEFLSKANMTELMRENIKYLCPYIQENVTDIHINRPYEVFIKYANGQRGCISDHNLSHEWLSGMCKLMANISDQEFDEYSNPLLSFKLPGGHRVQVVSGALTSSRFALAIRVNRGTKFNIADFGLIKSDQDIVTNMIKTRKTILVSGGTGSGKTSFINCLIPLINKEERIITIEDVNELIVPQANYTPLIYSANAAGGTAISAHDLFNASLRLDPDRIIIGEIRQKNAITFFNAINSGHAGSLATIHANSGQEALNKVCDYMVLDGKISSDSINTALSRLQNAIALIIQLTNNYGETRKAELYQTQT